MAAVIGPVSFLQQLAKFVARETRAVDSGLPSPNRVWDSSSNINHQFLLSGLGIEQTATRRAHVRGPPRCRLEALPVVRITDGFAGAPDGWASRISTGTSPREPVIPYVDNRIPRRPRGA